MAYDLHGNWEENTGFNAPLYSRSGESAEESKRNVVSVSLSLSLVLFCTHALNDVMKIVRDALKKRTKCCTNVPQAITVVCEKA